MYNIDDFALKDRPIFPQNEKVFFIVMFTSQLLKTQLLVIICKIKAVFQLSSMCQRCDMTIILKNVNFFWHT